MKPLLFFLFSLAAFGQTAFVPSTSICPAPQITVASQTGTVGSYAVVTLFCLSYDATVVLDTLSKPWTITAASAGSPWSVFALSAAFLGTPPAKPGPCGQIGSFAADSVGYLYLCAGSPAALAGQWMRSAQPMVSTW